MARFSRAGVAIATAGLGLLGLGMAVGNLALLALSAFPLTLLAYALATRPAELTRGERTLSTRTPRRGEPVEMILIAETPPGGPLVEIHAPLPSAASLDEGSNLVLHPGEGQHGTTVRFRVHARGGATLPPVRAESIDPLGLLAPRSRTLAPAEELRVVPRVFPSERVRRRGASMAQQARAQRLGVGSADFRELRDYAWGDPPKSIHWRATARRLSGRSGHGGAMSAPLVKEWDKEGRRSALVLLDGGDALRVGTSLESGLDLGVEAALAACRLLLDKGIKVGAATYGARASGPEPPESGEGQMPSLERALAPGEVDPLRTPSRVLLEVAPHLAGGMPVLVVVTRVTPANWRQLVEAGQRLRVMLRESRRRLPVYVVDVKALRLLPPRGDAWDAAARVVEKEDEAAARRVAASGIDVLPWRPSEDLHALLAKRGIV